jgi:hypothetical protein
VSITNDKQNYQAVNLPLRVSFCVCNCDLRRVSDFFVRSRMYCRRQRMKRRMNPASTTAEATANPAITAGWNGSSLGFGPPDGGGAVLSSDPLRS